MHGVEVFGPLKPYIYPTMECDSYLNGLLGNLNSKAQDRAQQQNVCLEKSYQTEISNEKVYFLLLFKVPLRFIIHF